jgi:AcrR family transcriptional regulator
MASDWLVADHAAAAAERILDAAGDVFAERGVARASIGDIARAAGCSRPTVYRYFEDREALHTAFMHREARRVAALVAVEVADLDAAEARRVAGILKAVQEVRARPTLMAWFTDADIAGTTGRAASSEVIASIAASFVGEPSRPADPHGDHQPAARWLVRIVLSLLAIPEASAADERALLERFVVPGLDADSAREKGGSRIGS